MTGMVERDITVGLPKFTLEYSAQLKETLRRMGIKRAFEDSAQLGKINKAAELFVDFVKQDAYLGIDEQGTEASSGDNDWCWAYISGARARQGSFATDRLVW